jgi:hypothetical protein
VIKPSGFLTSWMRRVWCGVKMTDNDLTEAEGDMQKLTGRIQNKIGDDRQVIGRWLGDHSA